MQLREWTDKAVGPVGDGGKLLSQLGLEVPGRCQNTQETIRVTQPAPHLSRLRCAERLLAMSSQ
jgi:hypothetical protein